jgi:hypothetical protein
VRPRLQSGRAVAEQRTSFLACAAQASGRPLNSSVRRLWDSGVASGSCLLRFTALLMAAYGFSSTTSLLKLGHRLCRPRTLSERLPPLPPSQR